MVFGSFHNVEPGMIKGWSDIKTGDGPNRRLMEFRMS